MNSVDTDRSLDLRGRTITTHILHAVHQALVEIEEGQDIQFETDAHPAIENDVGAWCRSTGTKLVEMTVSDESFRFRIIKGPPHRSGQKLAVVISDDGLFELLSPLGFALAASLEGHYVSLYLQGRAVRVLRNGFTARIHGLGRPFSRFPRVGLERAGHVSPQTKIAQIQDLGGRIYACGRSLDHYRVRNDDLAFDGVTIAAYFTFMEQMAGADVHVYA